MKHISPTAKILKSDVADGRHVGQYISGYNSFIHSFIHSAKISRAEAF